MFSTSYLRKALTNGREKKYELFREIGIKAAIEEIKSNPVMNEMANEVKGYAASILNEKSPQISFYMLKEFERSGNRLIFENPYFERRKQLFSLVIAYVLEKEEVYIKAIEEKLWEWCDLYTWELSAHVPLQVERIKSSELGPDQTVALFSAETAFFFSEILYILGDKLDELVVYRLKEEIFRRVINPYKENTFSWESANMNWASVCAGSVGAACIYLIEDDNELAAILHRILGSMESFLEGIGEDGLVTEGLGYWHYGFSFYVYFAELLKERTGGMLSLLHSSDKIKKIAELPTYLQYPSEFFVNFSDSISGKWKGDYGLFSKLEDELKVEGYKYPDSGEIFGDHCFRWAAMIRKLFWGVNAKIESINDIKTGMFYFDEAEWLIDRRKINNKFIAFAAKGGNNDEPHNHNDLGNFILHYDGKDIFSELGAPEYVRDYFREDKRYEFLAASSLGHSVPVINGAVQKWGKEHYAEFLKLEEDGAKVCYEMKLEKAYACEELKEFQRQFLWNYEIGELQINDSFKFNKTDNEIKETLIMGFEPKLIEAGKAVIETENFKLEILFDKEAEYIVEKCSYKNHHGEESQVYRSFIVARGVEEDKHVSLKIKIMPNI